MFALSAEVSFEREVDLMADLWYAVIIGIVDITGRLGDNSCLKTR
jgi:hypothetical protein